VAKRRKYRDKAYNRRMRRGTWLLLLWLIIGAAAAGQRGYFNTSTVGCSQGATIVVTMAAGPLNYLGVNPTIACKVPSPSG
jgi:hypothetical protein